MKTDTPKTIYLKDYTPFPFEIESLDLDFDIHDGETFVTAITKYKKKDASKTEDLFLYGEDLEIEQITLNDQAIKDYKVDGKSMIIPAPEGDVFTLKIVTKIYPEKNTRLEGLYNSGGTYCTQCEAEGFRRITYFPDRPDVLTTYTVRIEADKKYPVLLSNGNRIDGGEVNENRHFTIWEDPYPKPCYLFALVAGDLVHVHDTFTTASGNEVDLYIYVRAGDEKQCAHAMDSLKRSMKWDEDVYGLEYDLDLFNIVAVSDFNMGAMENKSLNIFNTALVLAHPETATDSDFMRVESVIAHEYFHNWSGNRVTCRDWFQLSLKEGLTVFRDQEFSSDTHSRDVQRIDDVGHLRRFQFPEDASPLAHPIRPDNYIEINNFYTMTVYEKGAEVIRMMRTIMGNENYRKGTDLYFQRHDGQAVTCDDFVSAMEDATGTDLSQFRLWYSQAGTPELSFKGEYDDKAKSYKVTLTQKVPDTAGQKSKKPMHIPVTIGLLDENGKDIKELTLHLKKEKESFEIEGINKTPRVASVLRGFSAPVNLRAEYEDEDSDLPFLMVNDSDGFNRWEAAQKYYLNALNYMIESEADTPECFLKTYGELLDHALKPDQDKSFMARMISLPDVSRIGQTRETIDPQAIYEAREKALNDIVDKFGDKLGKLYEQNRSSAKFSSSAEAIGRRILQNTALMIFSNKLTDSDASRAKAHYDSANNMTDGMAGLYLGCALDGEVHEYIISDFYNRFKTYPLVVDKWFAAQAQIALEKTTAKVKELRNHPEFNIKNPNRTRSLYSAFAMMNPVRFHAKDGSGYEFLTKAVIELNTINPQIAARLLSPMREWARYTQDRQEMMKASLEEILKTKNLAPDIFEIASKSLGK